MSAPVPRSNRTIVGVGNHLAKAGAASDLERRHDEAGVAGVRIELARAEEPRIRRVRIAIEQRLQLCQIGRRAAADGGVEVDVRPREFLTNDGKDVLLRAAVQPDRRRRPAGNLQALELIVFEHDQHDPRRQLVLRLVDRKRRVAPGEVLVVEIDRGEVVRLEVRRCRRVARCG